MEVMSFSANENPATGRRQEAPDDVKQRRLPRARATHNGNELSLIDPQIYTPEGGYRHSSHLVVHLETGRLQHRRPGRTRFLASNTHWTPEEI